MSRPLAALSLCLLGCSSSWSTPVDKLDRMVLSAWGDGTHDLFLHGTWIAAADDLFAVVGNLNAPVGAKRDGLIAHYGGGVPAGP